MARMQLNGPESESTGMRAPTKNKQPKDRSKGCSRCHYKKSGCPPSCYPEWQKQKREEKKERERLARLGLEPQQYDDAVVDGQGSMSYVPAENEGQGSMSYVPAPPPAAAANNGSDLTIQDGTIVNELLNNDLDDDAAAQLQDQLEPPTDGELRELEGIGGAPPGVDASSLLVLCDRSFEVPVAFEDLTEAEQTRAELLYNYYMRNRRGFRGLSNEALDQLKAQVYAQVRHSNLVTGLPNYKCCARPLAASERKQLARLRRQIDNAQAVRTDEEAMAQRGALEASGASQYDDRTLARMDDDRLAEVLGPFLGGNVSTDAVREELHSRLARLSLTPDPADTTKVKEFVDTLPQRERSQMWDLYHDFVNEEVRLIVRTIKEANAEKNPSETRSWLIEPATAAELDAELERSTVKEYMTLFKAVREPEVSPSAAAAAAAPFKALDETMWQHCASVAPTSFAFTVDCAALLGGTAELRAEAERWCLVNNRNDTYDGRSVLSDIGGCRPGKRWPFPWDKANNKPLPGFWPALKRVRQVKNELGGSIKTLKPWPCQKAYDSDPLIQTEQKGVVIAPKTGSARRIVTVNGKTKMLTVSRLNLMQQVFRKHGGETMMQNKTSYGANILAIELLRCYPVSKAGTEEVNSILDFVCWWHQTITTNEDAIRAMTEASTTVGKVTPKKMNDERRMIVYDLMCCPDCLTYQADLLARADEVKGDDGKPLVPVWAKALRGSVNDKVGIIINFVEGLKKALDKDVFQTPQAESVLWRGGYLYWDAREKYDQLSAPFLKAEELRKRHENLEAQVEGARTAAQEARDIADEAQDEMDAELDEDTATAMYSDVFNKAEQASRLEQALADLEARALAVDAEATEAERQVAQMPPSAVQERADALNDLNDSDPPSGGDRKRGREVYRRWQEMNPMKT